MQEQSNYIVISQRTVAGPGGMAGLDMWNSNNRKP